MNKLSPKKLLNSKWTAVKPKNKEKHFMVTAVEFDEEQNVVSCEIEAILTKRSVHIDWNTLKNTDHWAHGWK